MSGSNKKIIPKFQKKLQGFLSDESGRITKEDVLKIGMVAMGLAGISAVDSANAACVYDGQSSSIASWGNTTGIATAVNSSATVFRGCMNVTDAMVGTVYVNAAAAPYSVTVNGHANSSATIQGGGFNGMNVTIYQGQSHHSNSGSGSGSGSGGGWC